MTDTRFAFVFSVPIAYPPNIHDMKCYYLAKELLSRKERVFWVGLGEKDKTHWADGIEFANISRPPRISLLTFISIVRLVLFCLARRIRVIYIDDWMFFRDKPLRFLAGVIGVRITRIKVVLDERDPSVDFEVATGRLSVQSSEYKRAVRVTRLCEGLSSLIILTSKAYQQLYVSEGFPAEKVLGAFRGVDTSLFNPLADPARVRSDLGLDGKFVIGWFGLMHPFRLIKEVLVPMVHVVCESIPNAHIVIGGEGPLYTELQKLSENKDLPITVLGLVPYADLPRYIAACDVLLCPVNPAFRHTQNSAWLKIPEALAVGRPVIATRTKISELDYKEMKGTLWVEPTLDSFLKALKEMRENYPMYLSQAQEQARHFDDYSTPRAIAKIADRIELLVSGPTG